MAPESIGLCLWLGRRLKGEDACTRRIHSATRRLGRVEGTVPKVKHETASVLRVGWNANHARDFGSLDRTVVHVVKSRTWMMGGMRSFL